GFRDYFPNPLYMASVLLERTTRIWSGAMPMLLTVRPPSIVAEDIAWLAAAHPGRLTVAFAAGNQPKELALYEAGEGTVLEPFDHGLRTVAGALGTKAPDATLAAGAAAPAARGTVPLLAPAESRTSGR